MTATFDPNDKGSWYFGPMSREEANQMFENIDTQGTFLIRESKTHKDDFVLCVREGSIIKHYIINKITHDNGYFFKIGDQKFPDIPALLTFYQTHILESTQLTLPAPREKVITKYDFPGQDEEDLPFKKGDILEVISKDEDRWWTAINSHGRVGQIPVPYVTKYDSSQNNNNINVSHDNRLSMTSLPPKPETRPVIQMDNIQLPATAIVIRPRIPNAFDKQQLKLNEGEVVTVTQTNPNGKWYGMIGDRQGFFPYTHVQFVDEHGAR